MCADYALCALALEKLLYPPETGSFALLMEPSNQARTAAAGEILKTWQLLTLHPSRGHEREQDQSLARSTDLIAVELAHARKARAPTSWTSCTCGFQQPAPQMKTAASGGGSTTRTPQVPP